MKNSIFILHFLFPVLLFAVPDQLPENMRPEYGDSLDMILPETDYFGKAKHPQITPYDPFRSSEAWFGPSAAQVSGLTETQQVILDDMSDREIVRYGSLPTVAITYGRMVSILLMRNGKILLPKNSEIIPPPEALVQVVIAKRSPYIYLQAKEGVVFPDNYNFTHMFIPVDIDGVPVQFQVRLEVVAPRSNSLKPMKILDMVGPFPNVYSRDSVKGSVSPVGSEYSGDARQAFLDAGLPDIGSVGVGTVTSTPSGPFSPSGRVVGGGGVGSVSYYLDSGSPVPVRQALSRQEVREYFPTMVEMAKLYERAVMDGVEGYTDREIVKFRPASVLNGRVVSGLLPAFRNPADGQLYYLPWGYYYPEYDAIVYELVFKNESEKPLWWNYSLLKVLFGFGSVNSSGIEGPQNITVVSPESYEKTPVGEFNTLWVLVQGKGINPVSTPVRFLFPPSGEVPLIPVLSSGRKPVRNLGIEYVEGTTLMLEGSSASEN